MRRWVYVVVATLCVFMPAVAQDPWGGGGTPQAGAEQWFQIEVPLIENQKGTISVTFNQSSPREVFQVFGIQMNLSFVVSPRVTDLISVSFKNADIVDAFKTIMKMYNLYYLPQGNIIRILSHEEYRSEILHHHVETRVYDASILDLKNLPSIINPLLTPGIGFMAVDQAASKLVIRDTKANLSRIEKIYQQLTALPKMVEIETRILEVTLDDAWSAGVNWSALFSEGRWQLDVLPLDRVGTTSILRVRGAETIGDTEVTAAIQATLERNQVRVLSQPKILAVNRGESTILIGDRLPYLTGTNVLALEFLDVGIKLRVQPMITPAHEVRMDLKVELSSAEWITILPGYQAPKIKTTSLHSDIVARSGDIVIIGGLIKTEKIRRRVGVPILGDIPVLDWFFSHQKEETVRSEMAILLMPRVVDSGQSELSPLLQRATNELEK